MRLSGFADGGHDFPGYASAAAHLVSGDVVGDEPENRGECSGTAKHFGSGKLPHRLGAAAQAAARDGAAWPRSGSLAAQRSSRPLLGAKKRECVGRQTLKKSLVVIAAEEDGAGIGRIRMKRIRRASKQQLHGFIQEAVEPDSPIHTDGWEGMRAHGGLPADAGGV